MHICEKLQGRIKKEVKIIHYWNAQGNDCQSSEFNKRN